MIPREPQKVDKSQTTFADVYEDRTLRIGLEVVLQPRDIG